MAENLDNSADEKRLDALTEIENAQKRIDELLKRQANSNEKNAKKLQQQIDNEQKLIKLKRQEVTESEKVSKELDYQKKKNDEIEESKNRFFKLSKNVQTVLTSINHGHSATASISDIIVNLKKKQLTATESERNTMDSQLSIMEALRNDVEDIAKKQVDKIENLTEEEKLRMSLKGLSEDEVAEAVRLLRIKEGLIKKQERIHELQHQVSHLSHSLPEGFTSSVKSALALGKAVKAAGLAMGPLVLLTAIIGAGIHAFIELDKAAEDFRKTTGLTTRMTGEIEHQAHNIALEYAKFGVHAKEVYDVHEKMANAQSDMFLYSEATVGSLSVMNKKMGIAAEDSSNVASMFEQMGGLSANEAASAVLSTASALADVGVSAKEAFEDMSKSSGVMAKYMKGNVNLFIQSAAKAKMLGTTLEKMGSHAEKLLDFETGIEAELVAATFVGGQFNLSRARALAYEGKIAEAQDATLDALEQSGDFSKQDYHTKKALAAAAGMEVEEIEKQLAIRDKLSGLSGEQLEKANKLVKSGVDIRDLSDDELKAQAANLANTEKLSGVMSGIQSKIGAIVEQFGGRMAPLIESLGKGLLFVLGIFAQIGDLIKYMQENTWAMVAGSVIMGTLATAYLAMKISSYLLERKITAEKRKQLGPEIATASASIFGGFGKLGPWGIAGAIAAIAIMTAGAYALMSKGDDVYSPATAGGGGGYGSRVLMGPEGAIQLNNKDSVIAGTDLFSNSSKGQSTSVASPVASSNNNMIGALINEFRGVRADMASGKIGVYMDNDKVTANVATTMERSTRNNFALT
jgi:hypothetical protein